MKIAKKLYFQITISVLIVLFSVSCETEKKEGKPWDGYEVKKMNKGYASYSGSPPNGIPRVKAGDIYWYYIDAEEDVTYSINMNVLFQQIPPHYALNPAFGEMTGYKEDGTIFWETLDEDYYNQLMTYYSPIDQRLYIRFRIRGVSGGGWGYFVFGYTTD